MTSSAIDLFNGEYSDFEHFHYSDESLIQRLNRYHFPNQILPTPSNYV